MKSVRKICLGLACFCIALGIVLAIFAYTIGGNRVYYNTDHSYELEDTVEEVMSLDFDISLASVQIETGDNFHVSIRNMPEDAYKSYVQNGTWVIREDENSDNFVNLFGLKLPIHSNMISLSYKDDSYPKIIITIPEGFHADKIKLRMDAGTIYADKLSGDNVDIEVGAGSMHVKELIANNYADMECGVGELVVDDMKAGDVNLDCGFGSIRIDGSILGDCYAESGVGNIALNLEGNEEDYNYTIDCGIGNVILNESNYSFTANKTIRNKDAIGSFDLDCGIGQIELYVR